MAKGVRQNPARRCRSKPSSSSRPGSRFNKPVAQVAPAEAQPAAQLQAAEPRPPRRPRPPGPDTCHQFVRRQLAKALPELFLALLKRAHEGDLAAVKLLWQLAQLDKQAEQAGDQDEDRKFVRSTLAKYRSR